MEYLRKETLVEALKRTGLEKGDTVIVHSDISSFGITENFSKEGVLNLYYDAFMEVLGKSGTLCTPAYFYEYARHGIPFDIALSPVSKELGVFARFINSLPSRKRSCNPITSVCAIGKKADDICQLTNRHSYGTNSAFDILYNLNAKVVLLGIPYGATIVTHLAEFQVGVPYLYNKILNIPILNNGELVFENAIFQVRYLDYDIIYKGHVDKTFHRSTWLKEPFVKTTKYLSSEIFVAPVQESVDYMKNMLYQDPYSLLTHVPNFIEGKVPNDGPVIKK